MVGISQSFFYNVQSKYFLSLRKKGKLEALEQCYWELVEQYRGQKRQLKIFINAQEVSSAPLAKAADALSDAYSLLAKNNVDNVPALLDKAKIELKYIGVLRRGEQEEDSPVEIEEQIIDALADSEEDVIIRELNVIDVASPFGNAVFNIDTLVSAGRSLVMSGVLKNKGSDLLKAIDQIVMKQVKYNETLSEETSQDLLKLAQEGFEQIISLGGNRHKTNQDDKALITLKKLGDVNLPKKSGVIRKLRIDEIRRLFSVVKKQNTISIRLAVVGNLLQIENLFSKLEGRKIEFGLEKEQQTEKNLLLWRVSLSPELMLYVVGLPDKSWQDDNTERDLLFTEFSSVTLLTGKQTELTVEEDLTKCVVQILCGPEKVRLRGPYQNISKNDACDSAWALIDPLLIAS